MNIIDYTRGNRSGKQANSLERQAVDDPFVADAIEGYEKVKGDHRRAIERMRHTVAEESLRYNHLSQQLWVVAAIVASVAIAIVVVSHYRTPEERIKRMELLAKGDMEPTTAFEIEANGTNRQLSIEDYADSESMRVNDQSDQQELIEWIASHYDYHAAAADKGIEGKIVVELSCDSKGLLKEVTIVETPDRRIASTISSLLASRPEHTVELAGLNVSRKTIRFTIELN